MMKHDETSQQKNRLFSDKHQDPVRITSPPPILAKNVTQKAENDYSGPPY